MWIIASPTSLPVSLLVCHLEAALPCRWVALLAINRLYRDKITGIRPQIGIGWPDIREKNRIFVPIKHA